MGATYYQDSITLGVVVDVVPRISILEEWHDDEWPVIKNISAEELCWSIRIQGP